MMTRAAGILFGLVIAGAAYSSEITSPQNWQVIQRQGKVGDIPVCLELDRGGAVEGRLLHDGKEVMPWTACGAASRKGPFKTKLKAVPQGGWYTLEVKVGNNVLTVPHVGVGIIVGVIGQSNASGYYGPAPFSEPSPLTSVYRACGVFEPLQDPVGRPGPQGELTAAQKNDPELRKFLSPTKAFQASTPYLDWNCSASCWPDFSRLLAEHYKVPVMIVCGARGSTTSAQWLPPALRKDSWCNGLYEQMLARIQAVGGRVSAIIVNQGEQDCLLKETAYATWLKNTKIYTEAFRKDLKAPDLPFLFVQIGVYSPWTPAVRQAIEDFCDREDHTYLAACAYDLPGGIHYGKEGLPILAARLVNAYRNVVGGETKVPFQGPRAQTIELSPARDTVTVTFDQPVAGLEGRNQFLNLQVFTDRDTLQGGLEVTPTDALWARMKSVRFRGNKMTVQLARPLEEGVSTVTLRYAWLGTQLRKYPGAILRGAEGNHLPALPFNLEQKLDAGATK